MILKQEEIEVHPYMEGTRVAVKYKEKYYVSRELYDVMKSGVTVMEVAIIDTTDWFDVTGGLEISPVEWVRDKSAPS